MNTALLHFRCGDPLCEEPDCVVVHLIREPGDASLELAPWWRASAVEEPLCGTPLREHWVEELRALAEERANPLPEMRRLAPPQVVGASRGKYGSWLRYPWLGRA